MKSIYSAIFGGALAYLGLLPASRAVSPLPDGGYPGFNTAEGPNALLSLTTGSHNTAIGWNTLKSDTTAGHNTALGAGTLYSNTADGNTGVGAAALFRNTTGNDNTATGLVALYTTTPVPTTQLMEHLPFSIMLPAAVTQPPALMRSPITSAVVETRPTV